MTSGLVSMLSYRWQSQPIPGPLISKIKIRTREADLEEGITPPSQVPQIPVSPSLVPVAPNKVTSLLEVDHSLEPDSHYHKTLVHGVKITKFMAIRPRHVDIQMGLTGGETEVERQIIPAQVANRPPIPLLPSNQATARQIRAATFKGTTEVAAAVVAHKIGAAEVTVADTGAVVGITVAITMGTTKIMVEVITKGITTLAGPLILPLFMPSWLNSQITTSTLPSNSLLM